MGLGEKSLVLRAHPSWPGSQDWANMGLGLLFALFVSFRLFSSLFTFSLSLFVFPFPFLVSSSHGSKGQPMA